MNYELHRFYTLQAASCKLHALSHLKHSDYNSNAVVGLEISSSALFRRLCCRSGCRKACGIQRLQYLRTLRSRVTEPKSPDVKTGASGRFGIGNGRR